MIITDTETTGLIDNIAQPLKDQPQCIELFALKLNDEEVRSRLTGCAEEDADDIIAELVDGGEVWQSLFRPNMKIGGVSAEITEITGITPEMVEDAPAFAHKFESLTDFFLGERQLIGHNLAFDRDIIAIEVMRLGKTRQFPWPPVHRDTVESTEGEEGFRLGLNVLHERLFGKPFEGHHRAEADVRATARCCLKLFAQGKMDL